MNPGATFGSSWPYLVVILVGFLPNEIWRVLAVYFSRGLSEESELLILVRFVATTLLAGVVAKLLIAPSGALAAIPMVLRFGSLAAGVAGFFLIRRSMLAGVVVGEAVLVGISWWLGV